MTTSFDLYQEEFTALIQQILRLQKARSSGYDQAADCKNLLQQCDDLIKQMALEARSGEAEQKQQRLDQVKAYKAQYQQLVQQTDRQGLLGTTGRTKNITAIGSSSNKQDERLSLYTNEDKVVAQNDTLERACRSVQETEQVALEITNEMGNNRETLSSAHGRIWEVSSLTERAMEILSRLKK